MNRQETKYKEILETLYNNVDILKNQRDFFNNLVMWSSLVYINENEKILYITPKTNFYKKILETNYLEILKQSAHKTFGSSYEIQLLLESEWKKSEKEIIQQKLTKKTDDEAKIFNSKSNENYEENSIKEKFNFDNYVVSDSNKMIYSAAFNISINPGGPWNPLFIYGGSGLGKTHILHAIGNEAIKNSPNFRVKYIQAKDFGELVHNAIKSKNTNEYLEDIKKTFLKYNMLLVDDIQFIQNWNKAKEIFFHILNHFIEEDKQVIITSDVYPQELDNFEQRFITRFEKGLTIGVVPPDLNGAIEIVKRKMKLVHDFDLNYIDLESIEYLANNFSSNIRELEGAINRVIFWTINNDDKENNNITIDLIEKIFKNQANRKSKLTIKDITSEVSKYYAINYEEIIGSGRTKNVLLSRHIVIFLSRNVLNLSLMEISNFFNKNHSTIINSLNKINKEIELNPDISIVINKIKAILLK